MPESVDNKTKHDNIEESLPGEFIVEYHNFVKNKQSGSLELHFSIGEPKKINTHFIKKIK